MDHWSDSAAEKHSVVSEINSSALLCLMQNEACNQFGHYASKTSLDFLQEKYNF